MVCVCVGYMCVVVCMYMAYVACMQSGVCVACGVVVYMCVVCVWYVCVGGVSVVGVHCVLMRSVYGMVCGVHVLCVYSMWCAYEVFV